MKNKVYLVSKVMAFMTERMTKEFKVFEDENTARAYFDTLVNDYIIDSMDYYECNREELNDYIDIELGKNLFTTITKCGEEEIEIQLEEMRVY